MESAFCWREKYAYHVCMRNWLTSCDLVTDMLVAVLNCCTKEELDESSDEDEAVVALAPATAEKLDAERRQVIKNKILAVGRLSRVFSLLRLVHLLLRCLL